MAASLDTTTTIYDRSGYGNDGTWYGNGSRYISLNSGEQMASFDGSTDQVVIVNDSSLQTDRDYTIMFWAYPTNVSKSRQNPVAKAYGGEGTVTMEPSGALSFYHGEPGGNAWPYIGFHTSDVFSNDVFVFVAITRNRNARILKLYKNGNVFRSISDYTYDPSKSNNNFTIGKDYAGYFQGNIDQVRLFGRELLAEEILSIYNRENIRYQ